MTPSLQAEIDSSSTSSPRQQLAALLENAGLASLDRTGWIRVTGGDRVRWLNGMVTNSIQQLQPGEGNYNFFLSVQGRIQGDAYIFVEPEALLIETGATRIPAMMTLLDRFIIMDDVELTDITAQPSGLLLAGPRASTLLAEIGLAVDNLKPLHRQTINVSSSACTVIHAYSPLVPRYELWTSSTNIDQFRTALAQAGAVACESESVEFLRLVEKTPLYGTDIRDRELPQETAQERALHFAKGCYLGQEIVERIHSRGNVHRTFAAFHLEGALPPAGSKLEADGKEIGELTSVAAVPLPGEDKALQLALGYIRRDALDRATPLRYSGGLATPAALPFFIR